MTSRIWLVAFCFLVASYPIRSHAAPIISIETPTLSFTGAQYSAISSQSIVVSNSGDADLNYAIESDVFWLHAGIPSGNLPAGQATSHVVSVSTLGLEALRTHTGSLTISDPSASNNPQQITVNLTLSPSTPPSRVVMWGNNTYFQTNVPPSLTNAVVIAGGGYHSLAIRSGGTVTAWGTNGHGQTNTPAWLSNVVSISCGWYHSLARQADGTFAVWGRNIEGQTNIPTGLTTVLAIAGGSYHAVAAKPDGSVIAWGFNLYGQTNVPSGLTNVVAVAGGNYHSLALSRHGAVTAWGSDDFGQSTVPVEITNAVTIAGGGYHSLALLDDGTVAGWGRNIEGQINIPAGLSNVVAIAAGNYHSVALRSDESVVVWGRNLEGQTNVPTTLLHALSASAGGYHSMALVPSRALTISSSHGSPNPGPGTSWPIPDSILTGSVASNVTAGGTQYINTGWIGTGDVPTSGTSNIITFSVTQNSSLTWLWQTNYWLDIFATGAGSVTSSPSWHTKGSNLVIAATNLPLHTFIGWFGNTNGCTINGMEIAVPMSQARSLEARFTQPVLGGISTALSFTGRLYSVIPSQMITISNAGTGPLNFTLDSDSVWATVTPNNGLLPAGQATNCMVQVFTRGLAARSYRGNLTLSDPLATNSPRTSAISLTLENITPPHRVVAWGDNASGQTDVPSGMTQSVAVAGGLLHSLALQANGSVAVWGANTYGQTNLPAGISNAVGIAAGGLHSLALRNDGTVASWGHNTYGQSDVPDGLSSAISVAAGGSHSLALMSNGTVVSWGYNFYGQTNVPPSLSNVIAIAAGVNHSLALIQNGTVVSWGDGASGQSNSPANLTNAIAIAAANNYCLALRRDGSIVGWGDSISGQTNIPSSVTNAIAISAGHGHAMALQANGSVTAWGNNGAGQTNVPDSITVTGIAAGGDHSLSIVPVWPFTILTSHGTSIPEAGLQLPARDSVQECSITSSITSGGTQFVNTGWAGSGSAPATGSSNTLSFVITNDTSLTWLWQTNYLLTLSATEGAISSNAGWYSRDAAPVVSATNNPGYTFVGWSGDTNDCLMVGSVITVPMTQARQLHALFAAPVSAVSSDEFTFTGHVYSNLAPQTVVVSNAGYGVMNYTLHPDIFWLGINSNSGSLSTGESQSHSVTVTTRGLASGTHLGSVSVTSTDATNDNPLFFVHLDLTNPVTPVVCWGENANNQTNVPPTLTNAIAIAAGGNHSIALQAGRPVIWGSNGNGQTNVPASATNVIKMAGGWNHCLALLWNGTVTAWGSNGNGQSDVPVALSNVIDIAGGEKHSLALRSNGTILAWGHNGDGQTNVPTSLTNAVQISAGQTHSLALRRNGQVVAWGENGQGQTNVPAGLTNVVAVAAGGDFSAALLANGHVVIWGNNAFGQTNVPSSATNLVAISLGRNHVLALGANGRIYAWGDNSSGQTNTPAGIYVASSIAAGRKHSMALAPLSWKLIVTSPHASPIPPVGTNWYVNGTPIICTVFSEIADGTTQYVCAGWTGSGNVDSVTNSNYFSFSITTNSTLSWQWYTQYWLQTSNNGAGVIEPSSTWYLANSNITLTATPDTYRQFTGWTGSLSGTTSTTNPLTFTMTSAGWVTARFVDDVTSNGTPHPWLSLYGLTNSFEDAVTNDIDEDGMLTWEEFIANTDPTNGNSVFQMLTASNAGADTLQIPTSTGRLYALDIRSSILTSSWQGVVGQSNIQGFGAVVTLTNATPPAYRHYYRVRVKLP